ncbi:MAG: metallophosphoesterase family protein [Allosphingosinicella sp.]|uniref:metallophosphoesterase family protein n=1 Tax=Allosphingosinicella sp. TaxID=2823234 RepID=UPI003946080F
MATIAHLSDVHFGAHVPEIVEAAERWVIGRKPDLVIVSGDFTQRAREAQYRAAGAFMDRLESAGLPTLAVPGNHDVPLYDVIRRFARPLARYKRHIDDDLCPWFENDKLAVLGINTARSFTLKDGRINYEQMHIIRDSFRAVPPEKTRILVTHHPLFAMPLGEEGALTKTVGRQQPALEAVADAGVHILLAGHFHRTFAEAARKMVENAGPALVIQAGTATSTRIRADEVQSFNWLEVHRNTDVDLQVVAWNGTDFEGRDHARYAYDGQMWHRRSGAEAMAAGDK